jgi:hypothetical protein
MELTPFYGEGGVLDVREIASTKTLFYLLRHLFGFRLLYRNTWHLNRNHYFIT